MRLLLVCAFTMAACGNLGAYEFVPIDRIDGTRLQSLSANGRVVVGVDGIPAEPILWTREAAR